MTDSITVTTGARLHFGLLVACPPNRRRYGGIGLMIDQPRFSLSARRADQTVIHAGPETQPRIAELLHTLEPFGAGWDVEVHEEIPAHAGLGSGTQLALAVGTALTRLRSDPVSAEELARRLSRGTRSVVGTLGFERGGLIGQSVGDDVAAFRPPPVRLDFPDAWRFVLVTPPGDVGLSGESEQRAFREMPPMTDGQLQHLENLQNQLLSSAGSRDFRSFSESLQTFGQTVGEYFAPLQSGTIASRRMAELAERLVHHSVRGVGQTSWGPTLFAACESVADAGELGEEIRRWKHSNDCTIRIVAAKNTGAAISIR